MANPALALDAEASAPLPRIRGAEGLARVWRPDDVGPVSGSLESMSDAVVIAAIRIGDESVFDAICVAYVERLWRFAYGVVQSSDVAQDVVQDVLLSLWERRAEIAIEGTVSGYLFGAVRRRALMYVRNDRTIARISQTWPEGEIPGSIRHPEGPLSLVERDELRQVVAQALATLPDIRRQAVVLRWDQQLGYDEIAQVLGISPEAARAHVSRGYRTLRSLLSGMGIEPPQ